MTNQEFTLSVSAKSDDGHLVKCETNINIACESSLAVITIAKLIADNIILKDIFTDALVLVHNNIETTREVYSSELNKTEIENPEF